MKLFNNHHFLSSKTAEIITMNSLIVYYNILRHPWGNRFTQKN